jgi:hypothetical protein
MRRAAGAIVCAHDLAVQVMGMVVVVPINRDCVRRSRPEEAEIFRGLRHFPGDPGAADMTIQT